MPELNKYEIILLLLSLIVAHALKEQQMSHFIFVRHVMSMMPCLMTVFLNQATVDKLKKKKNLLDLIDNSVISTVTQPDVGFQSYKMFFQPQDLFTG